MLDSFDNDGLVSIKDVHVSLLHFSYNLHTQHDNPKIQIVLNDGSRVYEHHSDGQKQENANCLREFRNRPYPVKVRITYLRGVLEVRDCHYLPKVIIGEL